LALLISLSDNFEIGANLLVCS